MEVNEYVPLPKGEVCDGGTIAPLHPLARLSVIVHSHLSAVAESIGITPLQARMLGVLAQGPSKMADLARSLGVEKAALTGIVDRAHARDLVKRTPVPGDRRSTLVVITATGAAASHRFYAELDTALDELIAALPARQRDSFRAAAAMIADAAQC